METDRHGGHRPVCHKYLGEKNIHYLYTKICHVISCYAMKASCFKITSALYMVTSLPSFPLVDTHILTRAASLYHTLTHLHTHYLPLSLSPLQWSACLRVWWSVDYSAVRGGTSRDRALSTVTQDSSRMHTGTYSTL